MNIANDICARLQSVNRCHALDDGGVAVNTHCMYPSNGAVQVIVHRTPSGYLVSDDGGAIREAIAAGADMTKATQARYGSVAGKQGLSFCNGIVSAPAVPLEAVSAAIILVANASKEIADQVFSTYRAKRTRDFKTVVRQFLKEEFLQSPREELITGNTNKSHKFDNVIVLPTGRRAIVDVVLHDPNSINARVVANLDVRAARPHGLTQSIIYDDEDNWGPTDLSLLHITDVPVLPFSKAGPALHHLLQA
jgi:hypothetical protein